MLLEDSGEGQLPLSEYSMVLSHVKGSKNILVLDESAWVKSGIAMQPMFSRDERLLASTSWYAYVFIVHESIKSELDEACRKHVLKCSSCPADVCNTGLGRVCVCGTRT